MVEVSACRASYDRQAFAPGRQRRQRIELRARISCLRLEPRIELGVVLALHPAVGIGQDQAELAVHDIDPARRRRSRGDLGVGHGGLMRAGGESERQAQRESVT